MLARDQRLSAEELLASACRRLTVLEALFKAASLDPDGRPLLGPVGPRLLSRRRRAPQGRHWNARGRADRGPVGFVEEHRRDRPTPLALRAYCQLRSLPRRLRRRRVLSGPQPSTDGLLRFRPHERVRLAAQFLQLPPPPVASQ